jgi:RecB family endonuclease NucS
MTKRKRDEYRARRDIQDAGWRIEQQDKVAWNSGSETARHMVCKTLAGHYLKHEQGYRIVSEVEHSDRGEIDIVAYSLDGAPIAIECETSPTDEVVQDKVDRYVHGTIFRDVFVINVSEMPENIMDAYSWVSEQL